MSRQEIRLDNLIRNPDNGSVEVVYSWNGAQSSAVFNDDAHLASEAAEIITSQPEAVRWLLFYAINLREPDAELSSQIGKVLVVDLTPSVRQTIALVEAS